MSESELARHEPPGPQPDATGWRATVRKTPGGRLFLRVAALVLGTFFIALGIAFVVLPGPLTIPPILLGLYILSTEFAWADRLLDRAKDSAQDAWESAKKRPVLSTVTTVGGLVAAGVAIWAVTRYDLVARGLELIGVNG